MTTDAIADSITSYLDDSDGESDFLAVEHDEVLSNRNLETIGDQLDIHTFDPILPDLAGQDNLLSMVVSRAMSHLMDQLDRRELRRNQQLRDAERAVASSIEAIYYEPDPDEHRERRMEKMHRRSLATDEIGEQFEMFFDEVQRMLSFDQTAQIISMGDRDLEETNVLSYLGDLNNYHVIVTFQSINDPDTSLERYGADVRPATTSESDPLSPEG